jgi:hypothetical protein
MSRTPTFAAVLTILTLILGGCMSQDPPPEREFDQAEAYPLLEQTVLDTIAELPDFPGFATRGYMKEEDCAQLGEQYEGWVAIEIYYTFSQEHAESALVRTDYTNKLRQMWTDAGYDIHRDTLSSNDTGSIEAERPDGVNLWWGVAGGVSLTLQTGCVPSTPEFDKPDYIPPAGDVPPGGDKAMLGGMMKTPSESESSADAIAPFGGVPVNTVPFESPDSYEGHI